MEHIHTPRSRGKSVVYINPDANANDLARTLRRELGELRFTHLLRAMSELGKTKPAVLVAREQFEAIWRPI